MEMNAGLNADGFPEGVHPLDHTADIGMDIRADSLPQLFCNAALGLAAFACPPRAPMADVALRSVETVQLQADDAALLLAAWLRELLYFMETRQLCFVDAIFPELGPRALDARVTLAPCPTAIREIKGVTYHELEIRAEPDGSFWARVIFDV
jgi:SHS2 domain-containing protein